jgi:hypothetical protein
MRKRPTPSTAPSSSRFCNEAEGSRP